VVACVAGVMDEAEPASCFVAERAEKLDRVGDLVLGDFVSAGGLRPRQRIEYEELGLELVAELEKVLLPAEVIELHPRVGGDVEPAA
jgi:hypothetical protein